MTASWFPATLLKRDVPPEGERRILGADGGGSTQDAESVATADGTAPMQPCSATGSQARPGPSKNSVHQGYSDDRYLALFAGMAPAANPRFVLAVMLNEPRARRSMAGRLPAPCSRR